MENKKEIVIAVLTSGGDSPGMNAAIRAVVRTADGYGIKVIGIQNGFKGLLEKKMISLSPSDVSNIINDGGTFLKTSRYPEFAKEETLKKAASICKENGIDALIVIGGNGSMAGAMDLSKYGVNTLVIPATIDNDMRGTDNTIGFSTACKTASEIINMVKSTTESHERCMVVEVMGRDSGCIALQVAIAVGADYCVIPEKGKYQLEKIADQIAKRRTSGKKYHIIVTAEGSLISDGIDKFVAELSKNEKLKGIEVRGERVGYAQRGGSPTVEDTVLASSFGMYAVKLIVANTYNRVVISKNGEISSYPYDEFVNQKSYDLTQLYTMFQLLSQMSPQS